MELKLIGLMALAWLRATLLSPITPQGVLAWRWSLGVKDDAYGYVLAVHLTFGGAYTITLKRGSAAPVVVRTCPGLAIAMQAAQQMHRGYRKAARIAIDHEAALADINS